MNYVVPGEQLQLPMIVRCVSEGNQVTLPGPGLIADGDVTTQAGNSGENFSIEFIQDVKMNDPVLGGGHVYRIVSTFLAYATGP
jgi:hypothetical protein